MHEHAPVPAKGRHALLHAVDAWAKRVGNGVHVVFDGGRPLASVVRQMVTPRVSVDFSGSETADDVIVRMVKNMKPAERAVIVTSDKAILYEAKTRRCPVMDSESFVAEVFGSSGRTSTSDAAPQEKPSGGGDVDAWLETFGVDDDPDDERFDGEEFMRY